MIPCRPSIVSCSPSMMMSCPLVRPYPALVTAAKPLLRYYFPNDDDIETWRTEHPFTFDLPLGLRITF